MKIDVCDSLAMSRTVMANERTLLAYIRTGITFCIAGTGVMQFIQDGPYVLIGGWTLILAGIFFFFWGAFQYRRLKTTLNKTFMPSV